MSLFHFRRINVMVVNHFPKSLNNEICNMYNYADPPGPSSPGQG